MSDPSNSGGNHHNHLTDLPGLGRSKSAGKKVIEFVSAHLVAMTLSILCGSWIFISWVVYKAEAGVKGANIETFGDSVWWGIVTFLTVGYGDKYPVTAEGRVWAGVLMVAGDLSVAILTS